MIVTFKEENHRYESDPPQNWISSTKIVEAYSRQFDEILMSERCSASKKGKWSGMDPVIIRMLWDKENNRSTTDGSKFHSKQERKAIAAKIKHHRGQPLWVKATPTIDGIKIARDQTLNPGCYLEHICYSEEHGIIGQTDLMLTDGEYVDIGDYKTNKEIETESYSMRKYGQPECMLDHMADYEDCNYNHYALQLSIYMRLALIKNPLLKPGVLTMHHVQFVVESRDKYNFPTLLLDAQGDPIVDKVKNYIVPYMEKETAIIFDYIKTRIH